MPSPESSRRREPGHEREHGHDHAAADGAKRPFRSLRLPYSQPSRHQLARVAELRTRPFGQFWIDQR
jgi:hypothetical protein